jgi:hypothetical protein
MFTQSSLTHFLSLLVTTGLLFLTACDDDDDGLVGGMNQDDQVVSFTVEIANVQDETQGAPFAIAKSGVFDTPVGATAPAPIFPGEAYEISFTAAPSVTPGSGARLSFATMFIQSNDLFYAFPPEGLALFEADGTPRTGDVTDELQLYDAGTEVNEQPGVGANQAPRQSGLDTGADEDGVVQVIPAGAADVNGFTYPATTDVIRTTLSHDGGTTFTFRIENVSTSSTLATPEGTVAVPLSPGAWAFHTDAATFYDLGAPASPGLEDIAEDGGPGVLAAALEAVTGITVPLSPGAFAVHASEAHLYTVGQAASAGLEAIAEDGNPGVLVGDVTGNEGVRHVEVFNTPDGASAPGPIGPGGSYSFAFDARPGDRLSLASMYIQSNDLFYGFDPAGLALFGTDGTPVRGDVTSQVALFDAGTEVDEEPGIGLNQAIRQAEPDTGTDENGKVVRVNGSNGGFTYPTEDQIIRITITPTN